MQILAHRGCWGNRVPRNSEKALRQALESGFGFESDVRDYQGRMVISHNIADETSPKAEQIFSWLHDFGDRYTFAVNIKADGLKEILRDYVQKYEIARYFLFDMSVPQMVEFADMGLRFFTRRSEVEPTPVMLDKAAGVWIDGFWSTEWITEAVLAGYLDDGKEVCLVSPDLHGKTDYSIFWDRLRGMDLDMSHMLLCTDHPLEARKFFEEGSN